MKVKVRSRRSRTRRTRPAFEGGDCEASGCTAGGGGRGVYAHASFGVHGHAVGWAGSGLARPGDWRQDLPASQVDAWWKRCLLVWAVLRTRGGASNVGITSSSAGLLDCGACWIARCKAVESGP